MDEIKIGDKVKIYSGEIGTIIDIHKNEYGKYEVEVAITVTETLDLDMIEKL
jgi:preprotein translocase subunit YajC